MKLVPVSAELVEDLCLHRFCMRIVPPGYADYYLIDQRRLKRAMRRLPAQRARAEAAFKAEAAKYEYRTIKCAVFDDLSDEPLSEEQKAKIMAWWDKQLSSSVAVTSYRQSPFVTR
jgi:hypothetical protein